MINRYKEYCMSKCTNMLWKNRGDSLSAIHVRLLFAAQITFVVLRDIFTGELKLWAGRLSYTSLLTLTPLLALMFSLLKTIGVHQQATPVLIELLQPLGDKGVALGVKAIRYIENIDVGVLGFIGLLMLIYLAASMIQQIAAASNSIWQIKSNRTILQRLIVYGLFIVIGPVLFFSAIAMTVVVMNTELIMEISQLEGMPALIHVFNQFVPYLFVATALTITYYVIPNTKVSFKNALIGGVVAGVIWESTGWLFTAFVVSSANYQLIYSSFAIIILFLIWLHISWLIFLAGVSITFYMQNPDYLTYSAESQY